MATAIRSLAEAENQRTVLDVTEIVTLGEPQAALIVHDADRWAMIERETS
jgi:hypothetical protein